MFGCRRQLDWGIAVGIALDASAMHVAVKLELPRRGFRRAATMTHDGHRGGALGRVGGRGFGICGRAQVLHELGCCVLSWARLGRRNKRRFGRFSYACRSKV